MAAAARIAERTACPSLPCRPNRLPAPSPGRFAEPDPALPPIRIHSAVKGPELVVIDTNQSLPAPSDKEIVVAHAAAQTIDPPDRD